MPKNSKEVVNARRQKVAEMYLTGKTQIEIATHLGVSEGQISKDLKYKLIEWKKARATDLNSLISQEIAKVNHVEKTYWEAWEKSKTNYKKKGTKVKGQSGKSSPDYQEISETEIIKDGDPRFLQGIERLIERRCKIMGLDAPIKAIVEDSSFLHFLQNTE